MDWASTFQNLLTDDRLTANLIAGHAIITVTFVLALIVRRVLQRADTASIPLAGDWLRAKSKDAIALTRRWIIWGTLCVHFATALDVTAYHLAGRDIRSEAQTCLDALSL